MTQNSRIELARQRLRIARRAIGVAAAAGFVVFAFAARASHPGSGAKATASTNATSSATTDDSQHATEDDFSFGQPSIAPSTGGGFSVQSGGS
jgi:hypothetical protein